MIEEEKQRGIFAKRKEKKEGKADVIESHRQAALQ